MSDASLPLIDAGSEPDAEPEDASSDANADAAASVDGSLDAEAGVSDGAAPSLDAAATPDAAADAAQVTDAADGGSAADVGVADAGPITRSFAIAKDEDDGLWLISGVNTLEERTFFSAAEHNSAGYTIEVGTDGEQCRAGLRFQLPLARGARIVSASLTLTRVGPASNADPNDTIRVHVYETDSVGAFDHAHVHSDPKEHVTGGVWSKSVGGFRVGVSYVPTESGDLSELVQHVVDRPGWVRNAYVGFLLTPDQMPAGDYAQFADSTEAGRAPATLKLTYFDAP